MQIRIDLIKIADAVVSPALDVTVANIGVFRGKFAGEVASDSNQLRVFVGENSRRQITTTRLPKRSENSSTNSVSLVQRPPLVSRRKSVTALVMFFIITTPSRAVPRHAASPSRRSRDHVAAPDKRRRFAFHCNRPHLIKRESNIITAARVVKDIGGLISPACSAAAIRCAQRYYALIIHIEKLPIQFRLERTSAASNSCGSKQPGKLIADLSLARATIRLLRRSPE